jgi:hypothetical protein
MVSQKENAGAIAPDIPEIAAGIGSMGESLGDDSTYVYPSLTKSEFLK